MVYIGLLWFILVYYGLLWFILVYIGLYWFILVYNVYIGLYWFIYPRIGLYNGIYIYIFDSLQLVFNPWLLNTAPVKNGENDAMVFSTLLVRYGDLLKWGYP